jgi:four helix bundle protein
MCVVSGQLRTVTRRKIHFVPKPIDHRKGLAIAKPLRQSIGEKMKTFRTLELAVEFYKQSQGVQMPKHLREQFDRAASSISLNLAEGNAKFSFKDKFRIYQIANGSLRECQTILRLADITDEKLLATSNYLGISMHKLLGAMMPLAKEN